VVQHRVAVREIDGGAGLDDEKAGHELLIDLVHHRHLRLGRHRHVQIHRQRGALDGLPCRVHDGHPQLRCESVALQQKWQQHCGESAFHPHDSVRGRRHE
jgi:hypothetical protein